MSIQETVISKEACAGLDTRWEIIDIQCLGGHLMELVLQRMQYHLRQLAGFYYQRSSLLIPRCCHGHCNDRV